VRKHRQQGSDEQKQDDQRGDWMSYNQVNIAQKAELVGHPIKMIGRRQQEGCEDIEETKNAKQDGIGLPSNFHSSTFP